jgi:transposase
MGGRPPHLIELSSDEYFYLANLVRDGHTEQRVARRARILMEMANPDVVVEEIAERFDQARNTIWDLCRRYDEVGTEAVFDAPRSGHPRVFSPSAKSRD